MVAPARKIKNTQKTINYARRFYNIGKARKKIETDIEIGDEVLIDCDAKVIVINKYNCAAVVEFPNGDRTVISFDRLTKL